MFVLPREVGVADVVGIRSPTHFLAPPDGCRSEQLPRPIASAPRSAAHSSGVRRERPFQAKPERSDGTLAVIVGWAGAKTGSVKANRH
jgi:hypothetical protein